MFSSQTMIKKHTITISNEEIQEMADWSFKQLLKEKLTLEAFSFHLKENSEREDKEKG